MPNLKKISKKIFFISILILSAITIGFWGWQKTRIRGNPNDYIVKETIEGKVIENEKAGLIIKVPEGWEMEKAELQEGGISFYFNGSKSRLENGQINLPLEKGCMVGTEIVYEKLNFKELENEARFAHTTLGGKIDKFKIIFISDHEALENAFELYRYGPGIGVYIPIGNHICAFYLYWAVGQKENCVQEFNKFLETLSITSF